MTAKVRVTKFGKRQTLATWFVLAAIAAIVGSQNWFSVEYEFGSTTKEFVSVGTVAIPLLNLAIWGGFITLFGVLFSQRVVSSVIAALGSIASIITAINLLPQLGGTPPQALFEAVSKLSGITGDHVLSQNGTSTTDGWISYAADRNLVLAFVAISIVLAVLQGATAALALRWPRRSKADRYATQTATIQSSSAPSKKNASTASKDDAISLWDSQR